MTDDPKGVENNIICLTNLTSRLDTSPKTENAWSKLCLFHHEITKTLEIVVFLDIDTVLTGNIDPLFDYSDRLSIC